MQMQLRPDWSIGSGAPRVKMGVGRSGASLCDLLGNSGVEVVAGRVSSGASAGEGGWVGCIILGGGCV